MIDMAAARDRYMSVYRVRGTPTPAVVLAQFLSSVAALEQSGPPDIPGSPLMVYSKERRSAGIIVRPCHSGRPSTMPTIYDLRALRSTWTH